MFDPSKCLETTLSPYLETLPSSKPFEQIMLDIIEVSGSAVFSSAASSSLCHAMVISQAPFSNRPLALSHYATDKEPPRMLA